MQKLLLDVGAAASQSVVLSTVPLPTRPPSHTSGSGTSSSATLPKNARYRHVLGPRAINPFKDLVALCSRDVDTPEAGNASGADSHAGLPPPPPGMSAAAAQALMRMRMIARAKALAQQKATSGAGPGDKEASTSSATAPKVSLGATLRLSLWRMASITGGLGERVWDLAVELPDLFEELRDPGATEVENVAVDAMTWSPDGQLLAIGIRVTRRRRNTIRKRRFIALHALQDGRQLHLSLIPSKEMDDDDEASEEILDMQWTSLEGVKSFQGAGSAAHISAELDTLPNLNAQISEEKEQKAKQRQRMMQRMRDPRHVQAAESKRAEELMRSEARGKGKSLLTYPRMPHRQTWGASRSSGADDDQEYATMLQVADHNTIHHLLDATIYLGHLPVRPNETISSFFSPRYGLGALVMRSTRGDRGDRIRFAPLPRAIDIMSKSTHALILLRDLASSSHSLHIYTHDCLVAIKDSFRSLHADNIAGWNRRARKIGKQYGTTFCRELMTFLMAGIPSDAMMAALLGNEAPSENDLKSLRASTASGISRLETLLFALIRAGKRLVLIYEEIHGCEKWRSRFERFFPTTSTGGSHDTREALTKLNLVIVQCYRALTMLSKEREAYADFYTWWGYERIRQEALRDDKPVPVSAEGHIYNVIVLSRFITRGFDNVKLEKLLDVNFDARTRGMEVDDDDDGEDEDASRAELGKSARNWASDDNIDEEVGEANVLGRIAYGGEPGSNDGPWFSDAKLGSSLSQCKGFLRAPPDPRATSSFPRRAPTAMDVKAIAASGELAEASCEGYARRRKLFGAKDNETSMLSQLHEIIDIMSARLGPAFAHWLDHTMARHEAAGRSEVELQTQGTLLKLHSNSLVSRGAVLPPTTPASSAETRSEAVRMYHDQRQDTVLIAHLSRASPLEGTDKANIILQVTKIQLSEDSSRIESNSGADIALGDDESISIKDFMFYSASELIILMHTSQMPAGSSPDIFVPGTMPTTVLLSLHLDDVDFGANSSTKAAQPIKPFRCAILGPDDVGAGATMLACNRKKDVCATLDEGTLPHSNGGAHDDADVCQLVYWDMVVLGNEASEDGQDGTSKVLQDKDDDMNG